MSASSLTSRTSKVFHSPSRQKSLVNSNSLLVKSSVWNFLKDGPLKIAVIGSGNWGSAIAKVVGLNAQKKFFFEKEVRMWVFQEKINGVNLTDIINKEHCNVKYLPGIKLPENVVADPDLLSTVEGAHILVFVTPHQFVKNICADLQGRILPGAKVISLVKGFDCENGKINLMSEYISRLLDVECCSLSGANVAEGVAKEEFSESTIGYKNVEDAQLFQQLFDQPFFRINAVPDVAGVEICGALKNIIALAAGFCDGLGYGSNTKAAVLRIGFSEMRKFAGMFYAESIEETFWDSAGIADLLTTCYGGRNRRCAEEFVRSGKSWHEIEKTLLNGQKLQGTGTVRDVHSFLVAQGKTSEFPLISTVYDITDCGEDPKKIVETFMSDIPRAVTLTKSYVRKDKFESKL